MFVDIDVRRRRPLICHHDQRRSQFSDVFGFRRFCDAFDFRRFSDVFEFRRFGRSVSSGGCPLVSDVPTDSTFVPSFEVAVVQRQKPVEQLVRSEEKETKVYYYSFLGFI